MFGYSSRPDCFPGGSAGKELACNAGNLGSIPGIPGKIPWKRERLPIPVFWSGEFHGLCSPWNHKELDMTERLSLSLSRPDYTDISRYTDIFMHMFMSYRSSR